MGAQHASLRGRAFRPTGTPAYEYVRFQTGSARCTSPGWRALPVRWRSTRTAAAVTLFGKGTRLLVGRHASSSRLAVCPFGRHAISPRLHVCRMCQRVPVVLTLRRPSKGLPAHIVPEYISVPFYTILRVIPTKVGGVLTMAGVIAKTFKCPLLNKCNYVASCRHGVRVRNRSAWWALTYALKDPGGLQHTA